MEGIKKQSFKQMPVGLDNFNVRAKDIAVYLTMRQYENWKDHTTFVSMQTLADRMGLNKKTIKKCIDNLISDGYLSVIKSPGIPNKYKFEKTESFEGFSDEFINNNDLTPDQKGYLAIVQQYMNTSDGETGVVSLRDLDLAKLTHMSTRTIYSYNKDLENKGYLTIGYTSTPDHIEEGGCKHRVKVYDPKSYGQAILFALRNHESRLSDVEDKQQEQERILNTLALKVQQLEKQQVIKDNQIKALHDENIASKKTIRNLQNALNLKLEKQGCRL